VNIDVGIVVTGAATTRFTPRYSIANNQTPAMV